MKKSTIKATEERIEKILALADAETAARQEKVTEAKAAAEAAKKAMDAAVVAGDTSAYQKAKKDRADALDAVEMHEIRLHALEKESLVKKEDYETTVDAIKAECKEVSAAHKARAREILAELREIGDAEKDMIDSTNKVLRDWQKISRDPGLKLKEGIYIAQPVEVKDWSLVQCIDTIYEQENTKCLLRD